MGQNKFRTVKALSKKFLCVEKSDCNVINIFGYINAFFKHIILIHGYSLVLILLLKGRSKH